MFPPTSKVLVVDDMAQIRDSVRRMLRDLKISNIIEADNGQKGWDILIEQYTKGSPFDLVLSDWNMPLITGIEFLRKVRADQRIATMPFILLTSESDKAQVTDAILAGVSQYIVKPFTPKSIEEKLKSAWAKHNPAK